MTTAAPVLSVVVPLRRPWSETQPFVEVLARQVQRLPAELVLVAAHPIPEEIDDEPGFRVIRAPGATVFDLRARGVFEARGDVVAVTEDHCLVEPDFCVSILAAHERHAFAGVVGGAVLPGPMGSASDWANFLLTFAHLIPPLDPTLRRRLPSVANVSFKRRVLPAGIPRSGLIEGQWLGDLVVRGLVAWDEAPKVQHVQSFGLLRTCSNHFHNGRATTGMEIYRQTFAERWYLLRRSPRRIYHLLAETARGLRARPACHGLALRSAPVLLALGLCHVTGEVAGLLSGAGSSPERLL